MSGTTRPTISMTVTVNATVWEAGLRNSLHRLSLDFAFRSPCVNRYLVNAARE